MNELRDKLKHGDMMEVARLAGVSYTLVKKTLYGTRNSQKVRDTARALIANRERLERQLKKQKA